MEYYNKIAKGYEELYRTEQLKKLGVIKNAVQIKGLLLDIGCGSGISLEPWECLKFGIDSSFELLRQARKKGLTVVQARAECLPFKDKSFGTVISISAAHHFDIHKSFMELGRVGKRFIITLPKKSVKLIRIKKEFKKKFGLNKEVMEEKDVCLTSF